MEEKHCLHCKTVLDLTKDKRKTCCNRSCSAFYGKSLRVLREITKTCIVCDKLLTREQSRDQNTFCSRSCSAKYTNAIKRVNSIKCNTVIKITKSSKHNILIRNIRPIIIKEEKPKFTSIEFKTCSYCTTPFCVKLWSGKKCCSSECSKNALQRAGKKSAATRKTRSVDEIRLFDLCARAFKSVRHNEQLRDGWDADVIIDDYKLAILWNGPWHYRDMPGLKHSLSQVQNRDRIKKKVLEKDGWTVLMFEDRHYTPESAFEEINQFYRPINLLAA
jgi:very-short-patch-repair endonuclease